MTSNCGHWCCPIAANPYHRHLDEPECCGRCAEAAGAAVDIAGLGRLVASVVVRVAPEIPGLPPAPELVDRIAVVVRVVHQAARHDAALLGLPPDERHLVLVGRAGLALAFGR